jgi:hypothetical protein
MRAAHDVREHGAVADLEPGLYDRLVDNLLRDQVAGLSTARLRADLRAVDAAFEVVVCPRLLAELEDVLALFEGVRRRQRRPTGITRSQARAFPAADCIHRSTNTCSSIGGGIATRNPRRRSDWRTLEPAA